MKRIIEDIKTGQFQRLYLLYGQEDYLKRQYRDKLLDALVEKDDTMNFAKFEGKDTDIKEVIALANTLPFFADRRVLLLVDTGFFKSSNEELASFFGEVPDSSCLIFVESQPEVKNDRPVKNVDERTKTFKALSKNGSAINFTEPDEKTLAAWMGGRLKSEGKTITRDAWAEFLSRTEGSMDNMDKEMEKLISYCLDKKDITLEDVEAVCIKQIHQRIFDLLAAIGGKNLQKALDLYSDMLAAKEPPLAILSMMITQFRQMYFLKSMASTGMQYNAIISNATKIGMRDFVAKKNMGLARNFTLEQIRGFLEDAAEFDEQAKTGLINDQMAVELLMVKYSK